MLVTRSSHGIGKSLVISIMPRDSELLLKFIGYFPDYLSALSCWLLRFFWTTFVETAVYELVCLAYLCDNFNFFKNMRSNACPIGIKTIALLCKEGISIQEKQVDFISSILQSLFFVGDGRRKLVKNAA